MTHHAHIDLTCPHCGKHHDTHTGFQDNQAPRHDDVSICIACAKCAFFDMDAGSLRIPTPAEQKELDQDEDVQRHRVALWYTKRMH